MFSSTHTNGKNATLGTARIATQEEEDVQDEKDPFDKYAVVMNDEEQYSIWPEHRALPNGWKAAGHTGSKAECLEYIEEHWVDMRPRSLRERHG